MNNAMIDNSIYVSGPIGNGGKCSEEQILINVHNGEDIYMNLIKKGWNPECPHMSYYPDKRWREMGFGKFDHATWLALDKMKVYNNKYFFYMVPEVYGESKGAKMEYDWAVSWGKKIFTDLKEVPTKLEMVI